MPSINVLLPIDEKVHEYISALVVRRKKEREDVLRVLKNKITKLSVEIDRSKSAKHSISEIGKKQKEMESLKQDLEILKNDKSRASKIRFIQELIAIGIEHHRKQK